MVARANRRMYIETKGMDEMEYEFEKAAIPNVETKHIRALDNLLDAAFAATQSKVHIDTGYLIESGDVHRHFVGDIWYGEISYARYPGIFELARGDSPSREHPAGGHHFFNAVEPFIPEMELAVDGVFDDFFPGVR